MFWWERECKPHHPEFKTKTSSPQIRGLQNLLVSVHEPWPRLMLFDACLTISFAGLNKKVCVGMGVAQLLIWAVWAFVTHHPSRWKLWVVVIGGSLAMLLEIYDFPPYWKFVDAHAIRHATAIPLTFLWWSFIRDDAEFTTSTLLKNAKYNFLLWNIPPFVTSPYDCLFTCFSRHVLFFYPLFAFLWNAYPDFC